MINNLKDMTQDISQDALLSIDSKQKTNKPKKGTKDFYEDDDI